MTEKDKPMSLPTVTVIAPCRNEVRSIRDAIQSILDNDYPSDLLEILVMDGMSDDGTREIVKEISVRNPNVRLVDNPHKIVPTALNLGIEKAQGEYVIRIDCHAQFAKNYLKKCIEVSRRTGAANVGGYCQTLAGANTPVALAIKLATSSPFGVGNSAFRTSGGVEMEVDTVPFGTFKKDLFEEVGPFDERLVRNQDIEMNLRLRSMGKRVVISPEIQLSYLNRATLRGLWQQSFNNGLWNPLTVWLTGTRLRVRHFVPLAFVSGILFLSFGALFLGSPLDVALAGYFGLYGVCSFVAAWTQNRNGPLSGILLTNAAFLVLHVSYGLGSFWGILTILTRWRQRDKKPIGSPLADRRE